MGLRRISIDRDAEARRVSFRTRRGLRTVYTDAGRGDVMHAYREPEAEGGRTYLVAVNHRLQYVGVEAFDASGELAGEAFIQGGDRVEEELGPRGVDLAPYNIIKRLLR